MSSKNLRFPAGISVRQAKKDAKSLAKQLGKPLHHCLDLIAAKLGFPGGWAKAMAKLQPPAGFNVAGLALRHFDLPLRSGEVRRVDLDPSNRFIVIAGAIASGKTMLALELARQALSRDVPVHFVTPPIPAVGEFESPLDPILQFSAALTKDPGFQQHVINPMRMRAWDWHWRDVPVPRRGGLLILDEAYYLQGLPATVEEAADWAGRHGVTVVLCLQEPGERGVIWESLDAPVGLRFEGMAPYGYSRVPGRQALLNRARELSFSVDEFAEFVVSAGGQSWAEVMRLPLPTPAKAE